MEYEKKSVDLSNGSRSCVSNIGILISCILAIVVGQGCINLKNAKSFEIDTPFADIEYEALEQSE